jgi:hypothetical protein
MRPKIRSSLKLLPAFPKHAFVGLIADRMACGMAIILRNSFPLFKTPEEWKFMSDTFGVLASFEVGRGVVFDGIASTIEVGIPDLETEDLEEYEEELNEGPSLSLEASNGLLRVLISIAKGTNEEDPSLAVSTMVCIEKLYKHMVQLILIRENNKDPDADLDSVPDKELWYQVAVGLYYVCSSSNGETSKKGLESCQRHLMSGVFMEEIPDEKWVAVMNTMTSTQPAVIAEMSRVNTLSLLGQMMVRLFPIMTKKEANWQVLTEVTKEVIIIADENMQNGLKPLYDSTVLIVSNIAKQLVSPNFGGEKRYCKWASDTFIKTLEKNGALRKKKTSSKGRGK